MWLRGGLPAQDLLEFESRFATEEACRDYLFALRWQRIPLRAGNWPVRATMRPRGRQSSNLRIRFLVDAFATTASILWLPELKWIPTRRMGTSYLQREIRSAGYPAVHSGTPYGQAPEQECEIAENRASGACGG